MCDREVAVARAFLFYSHSLRHTHSSVSLGLVALLGDRMYGGTRAWASVSGSSARRHFRSSRVIGVDLSPAPLSGLTSVWIVPATRTLFSISVSGSTLLTRHFVARHSFPSTLHTTGSRWLSAVLFFRTTSKWTGPMTDINNDEDDDYED